MKRLIILLFIASLLLAKRVVVVSFPGITLEDVLGKGLRNIEYIMENGAIGLANCKLNKRYPCESAYLSMGSARRLVPKEEARLCLSPNEMFQGEKASDVFLRNWGVQSPPNSLIHIGFPYIVNSNSSLKGKANYHLLGDLLQEKGVKVILLGNADTVSGIHREASCVLLNSRGIIREGEVDSNLVKPDPFFPGGLRTNFSSLKEKLKGYLLQDNVFILVETGDSLRVDLQYPYISQAMRATFIGRILKDVDDLIGFIITCLRKDDLLILISPYPGMFSLSKGFTLSPIIFSGAEMKGLLTSKTTKTIGVVSLYDFPPTILSFFCGSERLYLGRKVVAKPVEGQVERLRQIRRESQRSWTIHRIISGNIIGLTVGFFLLAFFLPIFFPGFRYFSLFPFILPLGLLILSPFPLSGLQLSIFLPLLLILIFFLCLLKPQKALLYISLALSFLILLDILRGGKLMGVSGIGHAVEEGARYYGIGNEFAGLVVGCLLLLSYYHQRFLGILIAWVVFSLLIGAPWWGANWGGFLTAISAFSYFLLSEVKRKREFYIYVFVFFLALFSFPIAFDIFAKSTHIGLAFRELLLGRVGDLLELVQRKVMTNVKLLRFSDWTMPLVVQIVLLLIHYIISYIIPKKKASGWFKAVFLSLLIAFAFNDSGVVASVFLLIPITSLILLEEIPIEKIKRDLLGFKG
ncbi:hypothetical protein H5T88_08755 [bacterium]|nr:hypothetical protein [bacterium]